MTCPERTLLDLCAVLPARRAGLALDDALRRRLTSIDRLVRELEKEAARGRNGIRRFRTLLSARDSRDVESESALETMMLRVLKRVGGDFVAQHEVTAGRDRYRLDFAYPSLKIGIECQSIRWHLGEERFKSDLRRDRALTLAGWTLLYFCRDDLLLEARQVEQEIGAAVAAANIRRQSATGR